jgi:hypothetical protein
MDVQVQMKWQQVDKYHLKSVATHSIFYISKSMICEKVIYELWNGNKWLYKSEKIEDAKAQALQHNKEQPASPSGKAK